jgi:AGCS family alanine or glycine:cation symporter
MKKNILISIILFFSSVCFVFSNETYSSNQIKDILSNKQYSYVSVEGLELNIKSDDVITFYQNGFFSYNVADKNAEGSWVLDENILEFTYPDTIRYFKIINFTKNKFSIIEESSNYVFHFEHSFSNKLNIFSITLDNIFKPIVDNIAKVIFYDVSRLFGQNKEMPFIVIWLIFGALFFTFKMNFINLRGFSHAISLVKGDYHDPNNKGEVSHFQALTTALSGTVGLGNIAGVAIAISLGGPGATFWMIIAGLIGMSSKFVECTLGVKYRKIDENGVVSGGPMYYLKEGLAKRNFPKLGKFLAILFAILCVGGSIGGGNMFQANQAFAAFKTVFPAMSNFGPIFGLFLALMVGFVIIGGIKSIAKVTEKIVPFMAAIYVGAALIIIGYHFTDIGMVFGKIISGAFSPEAGLGGFIGVLIIGFKRAAISNEAGVGSASIAHSAAKTKEPVSEGMVALLEPFIDTIVICTMTAIVIIITGTYANDGGLGGSELTSEAFGSVIWWFPYILTIAIFLFAFSTIISWSYYGLKSWTFLFGQNKNTELTYKILLLFFVVVGSTVNLGSVLDFSDMMILAMAFPNIIGLLFLSSEVKEDLKKYLDKVKNGSIKKFK